jgi:hypothetical protein
MPAATAIPPAEHVWVYGPHNQLICLATAQAGVLRSRVLL